LSGQRAVSIRTPLEPEESKLEIVGGADAPSIRPSHHIFVGSKAPWFEILDDLPQFEGHER